MGEGGDAMKTFRMTFEVLRFSMGPLLFLSLLLIRHLQLEAPFESEYLRDRPLLWCAVGGSLAAGFFVSVVTRRIFWTQRTPWHTTVFAALALTGCVLAIRAGWHPFSSGALGAVMRAFTTRL